MNSRALAHLPAREEGRLHAKRTQKQNEMSCYEASLVGSAALGPACALAGPGAAAVGADLATWQLAAPSERLFLEGCLYVTFFLGKFEKGDAACLFQSQRDLLLAALSSLAPEGL